MMPAVAPTDTVRRQDLQNEREAVNNVDYYGAESLRTESSRLLFLARGT